MVKAAKGGRGAKAQPKIYFSDAEKRRDLKKTADVASGKPKVVKSATGRAATGKAKTVIGKKKIVLGKKINLKPVAIKKQIVKHIGQASAAVKNPSRATVGQTGRASATDVALNNAKAMARMKFHPNKDEISVLVQSYEKGWIAFKKFEQELGRLSAITPTSASKTTPKNKSTRR